MADLSDVEAALRHAVAQTVYPASPGADGSGSTIGAPTRVAVGWPNAEALNADIAAGIVNVTIYARSGVTQLTTRYLPKFEETSRGVITLMADVAGQTVTFGGTAGARQLAGIRTELGAYAVAVAAGDGPVEVAQALAARIPDAVADGTAVTVRGAGVAARLGSIGSAMMETRRQRQGFMVTVWAPTSGLRDTAASVVDGALAQIDFLSLPDGSAGRLLYASAVISDAPSKSAIWRRDLFYTVEYPTTLKIDAATMLFGGGQISQLEGPSVLVNWGDIEPANSIYLDAAGDPLFDRADHALGVIAQGAELGANLFAALDDAALSAGAGFDILAALGVTLQSATIVGAVEPVFGALTASLLPALASASGLVMVTGALVHSTGASLSAAGRTGVSGSLSVATTATISAAGSVVPVRTAALAATAGATLTGAGKVTAGGSLASTATAASLNATAVAGLVIGTLSATAGTTLSAAAKATTRGTLSATTALATIAGVGRPIIAGAVGTTAASATIASVGRVAVAGSLIRTAANATLSAAGGDTFARDSDGNIMTDSDGNPVRIQ